jgi:hypothetical protein
MISFKFYPFSLMGECCESHKIKYTMYETHYTREK